MTGEHGGPGTSGQPAFARLADRFGRLSVVVSLAGLLVALGLSVVPGVLDRGGSSDAGPAYDRLTPAAPVRVSLPGTVAPVLATDTPPSQSLLGSPVDAPLVTWWSGSAKAGATAGQTVLTAHTQGSRGGLAAIGRLQRQDTVDLLTDQGTMRYEITAVRRYSDLDFPDVADSLTAQDGGSGRLVLVSAQQWDGVDYQQYVVATGAPLGQPR